MKNLTPEEKTALYMESVVIGLQNGREVYINRSDCDLCSAYPEWDEVKKRCINCPLDITEERGCYADCFSDIKRKTRDGDRSAIPGVLAIMVYLHGFKWHGWEARNG